MRGKLILLAGVLIASHLPCQADDKSDRERRVRVALALAAGADDCGKCREDVAAARTDALKGGRPVVLFVGGCPGRPMAEAAGNAGAIAAKAPTYAGDDRPPAERRIVVLEPKADGKGFLVSATLPPTTGPEAVVEAVRQATPKQSAAPAKLNWDF